MKTNCSTALAAALSIAYRSNEQPYVGPINNYLKRNGILLTMCTRGIVAGAVCSQSWKSQTISASWVQANTTGFSIYPVPTMIADGIGYVLDPAAVDIHCIYPLDAGTDGRATNGCGYPKSDPSHMGVIARWWERWKIVQYKNEIFGKEIPWTDIDCMDWFPQSVGRNVSFAVVAEAPRGKKCTTATKGHMPMVYKSYVNYIVEQATAVVGHDICTFRGTPPDPFGTNETWIVLYEGECSWQPEDWPHMMDTMTDILRDHSDGVWNEIVLRKPRRIQDIVQAVFYVVNDPVLDDDQFFPPAPKDRVLRIARQQAQRLGRPLLKVDPTSITATGGDLFSCPEDDKDFDDDSYSSRTVRASALRLRTQ